jgi:hypothetical protein
MLTNNEILKKLRVALQLNHDEIISILELVEFKITKGALGDLFRAEDHPNYVEAGDQILRNFLNGLVIFKRGPMDSKPESRPKSDTLPKAPKYQPNIVPKMFQKKEKSVYKPFVPKDQKPEEKKRYGSASPIKEVKKTYPQKKETTPETRESKPLVKDVKKVEERSKLANSVFKKDHFKK